MILTIPFLLLPLQCSTEYKVPGLYVVDSIVRQSRHQFGVEKDVFGPRFAKNFPKTFHNIFKCAEEDKVSPQNQDVKKQHFIGMGIGCIM